jgi:putative PIN family toxin of toxin-antitoxin system
MRILIDTNVLVSAFVFGGKAGTLMNMLFESSHKLLVSDYVDAEFKAILEMKWKEKSEKVYSLYHKLPFVFCVSSPMPMGNLRDAKDIPVLSDALFHHADMILSGDKDFIEAEIERPLVFSPSMLYDYLISQKK